MKTIERLARAIHTADSFGVSWDRLTDTGRGCYVVMARAVLTAMREPTDAMVRAAEENFFEHLPEARDWSMTYAKDAFVCAIDAALGE